MRSNLAAPLRNLAETLTPKPKLSVSEWADRYRWLSSMASPEPGRWATARTPYLREIMDCFGQDVPTEWIIFRSGTQVGKSEALNNVLGYYMHWAPRPIVMVQPTDEALEDYSSQRVDDFIKSSPVLRKLVGGQHTKDADGRKGKDAIAAKAFPGGMLFILPATSKPKLASKPAGVVVFDELNRAPRELAGEGSPVSIVEHRTQNYTDRKLAVVSTPTDEGDSPIDDWFDAGTKEFFEVPCPECGTFQALNFRKVAGIPGGVVWPDGKPAEACYECAHCSAWIGHHHKEAMLAAGVWVATAEPKIPSARSFHINALYSPWVTWGKLATKFVLAKDDPVKLRDFTTLDLAEAWRHGSGEAYDEHELAARAEDGWGAGQPVEVPDWVQVLTAFTDVQDDRLEVSVWGWDAEEHGCLIGHWVLWGDSPAKGAAVWGEAAALLTSGFRTSAGLLEVSAGGIDSGAGSHSDTVYWAVRAYGLQKRRIFATKGLSSRNGISDARPIWPQTVARKKGTATVVPLNVALAKLQLHLRMARPGFIRFPKATTPPLPAGWYSQLCAEELVRTTDAAGHSVRRWKMRQGVDRNEALDCMVGAYAAFKGLNRNQFPPPCGQRTDLPKAARPTLTPSTNVSPVDKPAPPAKPLERAAPPRPQSDYWASRRKDAWRRL